MKYLKPFVASFVLALGALASAQHMQAQPNVAERASVEQSAVVFDDGSALIVIFSDGSVLI